MTYNCKLEARDKCVKDFEAAQRDYDFAKIAYEYEGKKAANIGHLEK